MLAILYIHICTLGFECVINTHIHTFSLENPDPTGVLDQDYFQRECSALRLARESNHPRALAGFVLREHTLLTGRLVCAHCVE